MFLFTGKYLSAETFHKEVLGDVEMYKPDSRLYAAYHDTLVYNKTFKLLCVFNRMKTKRSPSGSQGQTVETISAQVTNARANHQVRYGHLTVTTLRS